MRAWLVYLLAPAAVLAQSGIVFRDAAKSAGLDFTLENHATPRKHLVETMPGGVAVFDYDGDGLTDVFFTNGAAIPSLAKESAKYWNRLFRNLGWMKFQDVTERAGLAGAGYSMGAAAADFDNDGHIDLFVAGVGRNFLYRNRGDGTFEDVTRKAGIRDEVWSIGAAWVDYDNDGLLDLFVANYLRWSLDFDRFCGDAASGVRVYCHPRLFDGLSNTLYRNLGNGRFRDVSKESGIAAHTGKAMSVAVADYDLDGYADLFVTNDKIPNFLFHNRGDGTFEEVALWAGGALLDSGNPISSMGADFRDYDNDGLPDILLCALSGETFPLFRNRGKGSFLDATYSSGLGPLSREYSGWSIGLVDLNNDGWKDVFASASHVNDMVERFEATRYKMHNAVFANRGGGTFVDVTKGAGADFLTPRAHRGCGFADFNNDGRIDVAVSSLGDAAELWENLSAPENNWLRLKLTGTKSNRDGIGAVVRIGAQHNHMTTSVGYNSSSHAGVHFGLGKAKRAEEIEIRWPSGARQILRDVPVNQVLAVREP